jgi:hypothetical protein
MGRLCVYKTLSRSYITIEEFSLVEKTLFCLSFDDLIRARNAKTTESQRLAATWCGGQLVVRLGQSRCYNLTFQVILEKPAHSDGLVRVKRCPSCVIRSVWNCE